MMMEATMEWMTLANPILSLLFFDLMHHIDHSFEIPEMTVD